MKKVSLKNKRYTRARQLYELKRRKWANGTLKRSRSKPQKRTRKPDFVDAVAPREFTLEPSNVKKSLAYIGKVKKIGKQKKDVNFILEDVEKIGIGAISMLISVMQELEEKNVYFKGIKPNKEEAKDVLEQSGFMKFVDGTISEKNRLTKNVIFTTGKSNTHQKIIVDAIHKANHTVWGEYGRSPLLYGTLVEMIKNSCKHAFMSKEKVRWHIAINHDIVNKKVKFSFVDNGIGIVKSFEKDDAARTIKGIIRNNAQMIKLAYTKGIESKTGLSWRGTGLPTIYESFDEDKIIRRLVVITNDVYADFENNTQMTLRKTFSGTYYYWEIDTECVKHSFVNDDSD
ncbi:MAG: hypothetical protein AAF693_17450 [Bacteroidota bacterium]